MQTINCPICSQPITENEDKLILVWYIPRSWWVTQHLKRHHKGDNESVILTDHTGQWRAYCGQAGINDVIDLTLFL